MAIDAAGPAQNDRASAAPAFSDGPHGHRDAAQRAAGLGGPAAHRHAAAARAPDRARRLLPRPPAPRRRDAVAGVARHDRAAGAAGVAVGARARAPPERSNRRMRRCSRCRRSTAPARWRSARSCSCSRSAGSACGRCCWREPGARGSPAAGGLAAATGAVLCTLTALVWVVNPYAAALLLPAAHLWLFAAAPAHAPARLGGCGGGRRRAAADRAAWRSTTRPRSKLDPLERGLDGDALRRLRPALVRRRVRRGGAARLPGRPAGR